MEVQLPSWTPRQIIGGTLIIALVGLGFWLLYQFNEVLIIFFAAIIISTAIKPIVTRLKGRGVPLAPGVIVVYGLFLVLIVSFIWLLAPPTIEQGLAVVEEIPERYGELRQTMLESPNYFIWRLGYEMPDDLSPITLPVSSENNEGANVATQDLNLVTGVTKALFAIVATLVLAFYWLLDGQRTIKTLTLFLPISQREGVRQFIGEVENRVGAFVLGQVTLCFIVGGLAFIVFLLLGVPNAFLLALMTGLLEALPLVGPIISAIPAALFAYSISPTRAIAVIIGMAVIQQFENQFLVPRIVKRSVGINPLVTLLSLMGFGLLFGIHGALVAIPLTAVFQLFLIRTVLAPPVPSQQSLAGRDQTSVLQYEVQELVSDLRRLIRRKESDPTSDNDYVEDTMETIAADLDSILAGQEPGRRHQ